MTYQPDRSVSTYGNAEKNDLFAAGWLNAAHPFNRGPVGDSHVHEVFCDRLFTACRSSVIAKMRGYHLCEFCDRPTPDPAAPSGWRIPEMRREERNGLAVWLGNGEVRVTEPSGRRWTAPTLIYHYVVAHGYKPPPGFVGGILNGDIDAGEAAWQPRE